MHDAKTAKGAAVRRGVVILVILAVLTVIEFIVGLVFPSGWLLLALALVKGVIVVQYFMHLPRVFSTGEEGH